MNVAPLKLYKHAAPQFNRYMCDRWVCEREREREIEIEIGENGF